MLPMFFVSRMVSELSSYSLLCDQGISQCLITARLGFAFDSSTPDVEGGRGLAATYPSCGCPRVEEQPKGIAIMVKRETESVSVDEHGAIIDERKTKLELCDDADEHVSSRELAIETTVTLPTV